MTPASAKSGQYHYYRCTDNIRCENRISAPALETAVVQTLQTVPFSDEIKKAFAEIIIRELKYVDVKQERERKTIKTQIEVLKQDESVLIDRLLELGKQAAMAINEKLCLIEKEIRDLKERLDELDIFKQTDLKLIPEDLLNDIEVLLNRMKTVDAPYELRRQLIVLNVKKITTREVGDFVIYFNYTPYLSKMAPAAGFEPATKWLTATYSTAELCRSVYHHSICDNET